MLKSFLGNLHIDEIVPSAEPTIRIAHSSFPELLPVP
jgi:hypothetical protein